MAVDVPIGPLIIHKPWTKQPPPGTPIDWSNPLTSGLVTVVNGNQNNIGTLIDSVTDSPLYALDASGGGTVDPTFIGSKFGRAVSTRPDKSYFWKHPTLSPAGQEEVTIMVWFRIKSWPTWYAPVFGAGSVLFETYRLFVGPLQTGNIMVGADDGAGSYSLGGLSGYSLEEWYFVVVTLGTEDPLIKMYINGSSPYIAGRTGNPIAGTGTYKYTIGSDAGGDASSEFDGDILLAGAWHNRVLSEGEAISLSSNPWQIFKPQTIYMGEPNERRRVVTF